MHLLRIEQSGDIYGDGEAVDLGQTPAAAVVLSAADTEINLLNAALNQSDRGSKALRLANILSLNHPYSVDLYIESVLRHAEIIIVRLLGGASYWPYGIEQISALARSRDIPVAFLSGDGKPDPELEVYSTIKGDVAKELNRYLTIGGMENALSFLDALDDITHGTSKASPPKAFLPAGLYWRGEADIDRVRINSIYKENSLSLDKIAAVVFYRSFNQAGDMAAVDGIITALIEAGLTPLPIFTTSLKDAESGAIVRELLVAFGAKIILNMTSFATSDITSLRSGMPPPPFDGVDVPILQVMLASNTEEDWQEGMAGLNPRDLAMHVVLPEIDGRIISRAVAFKRPPTKDKMTEAMITGYASHDDRCGFVADLAASWLRLHETPRSERKLALIMANYPNKDSRLANGVGLDTPASVLNVLTSLKDAGYQVEDIPDDTEDLIRRVKTAPTNSGIRGREVEAWLPYDVYEKMFMQLPSSVQEAIISRWGAIKDDPNLGDEGFAMPVRFFGHVTVAIQPARGYQIDPKTSYHSPDLPPPHHYLAFYFWLRQGFGVKAVIHMGKHGNLEWLPGKALALGRECFPDAVLGAIPHFYPFIVNDPGEGAQAKRRTAAVILDHLTPPMTLADSYGAMAELEGLMDEYYETLGLDKRRAVLLLENIVSLAERAGIAEDCGIETHDSDDEKLLKLDNFLCDLKEMQIRDGLHIYGQSPEGDLRADLLTAILRIPRETSSDQEKSILRSLAEDLGLDEFDPLTTERGVPWHGIRPDVLVQFDLGAWRHQGDTVERLNCLASALVRGDVVADTTWKKTRAILETALPVIAAAVDGCGRDEIKYLLKGLDGGYVPAGASGAPTRGRPEVLPTGRNFFSIDSRAVPTQTAWHIGWASASLLLERYVQDHGNYPQALVLSAWGTANMRTGGDDISQALALMGVRPNWDEASRRVVGFDVLPLSVLGRPRVDVTLRCSGFFRDAFPTQIALVDKAARAVGALDESPEDNPVAARMKAEARALQDAGYSEADAALEAGFRVFSTKPGAYGAGLQTLIDEGIWSDRSDFGEAFLTWSGYAYGANSEGVEAREGLEQRLAQTDGIIHNQDNREHDILDSDDYYQFVGGLSAAVSKLRAGDVPIYMGDHSLAERPVIRDLKEEISRVVRGRASNPKWIKGVMRHGYKGAFEMAATLDYLFAFAATTHQVPSHAFDQLYEAWIDNQEVYDFLQRYNKDAASDILSRFDEARRRGLWQPRRNSVVDSLEALMLAQAEDMSDNTRDNNGE